MAGRAIVIMAVVLLFWIVTAWPQGAVAMIWAAVIAILFAPRADQAYAGALDFMVGSAGAAFGAAVVCFALLPALSGFAAFAIALSLYLVPAGALLAGGWRPTTATAMVGIFIPFLSPTNEMTYDPAAFWNNATALFLGIGIAMVGFRLLPPPSPAYLAARLLRFSLRDLRRLAAGTAPMGRGSLGGAALQPPRRPARRGHAAATGAAAGHARHRGADPGPAACGGRARPARDPGCRPCRHCAR
jgi:uncharacterized membrane protein YccC